MEPEDFDRALAVNALAEATIANMAIQMTLGVLFNHRVIKHAHVTEIVTRLHDVMRERQRAAPVEQAGTTAAMLERVGQMAERLEVKLDRN